MRSGISIKQYAFLRRELKRRFKNKEVSLKIEDN